MCKVWGDTRPARIGSTHVYVCVWASSYHIEPILSCTLDKGEGERKREEESACIKITNCFSFDYSPPPPPPSELHNYQMWSPHIQWSGTPAVSVSSSFLSSSLAPSPHLLPLCLSDCTIPSFPSSSHYSFCVIQIFPHFMFSLSVCSAEQNTDRTLNAFTHIEIMRNKIACDEKECLGCKSNYNQAENAMN